MARRKPADDAFGAINHAGGRQITITAPYAAWVDWAGRALYAHDEMVTALRAAQDYLGGWPRDNQHRHAAELVKAALRKAGAD